MGKPKQAARSRSPQRKRSARQRARADSRRTRDTDDAHAVIGLEVEEAVDLDEAIKIARQLSRFLDMPQPPNAVTITDANGTTLY